MANQKPLVISPTGKKELFQDGNNLLVGKAILDPNGISAPRTQALPDKDGTFAMLSDISNSDFLSSFYEIQSSEIILIPARKQMVVMDSLELNGTLTIEGQLCLI